MHFVVVLDPFSDLGEGQRGGRDRAYLDMVVLKVRTNASHMPLLSGLATGTKAPYYGCYGATGTPLRPSPLSCGRRPPVMG